MQSCFCCCWWCIYCYYWWWRWRTMTGGDGIIFEVECHFVLHACSTRMLRLTMMTVAIAVKCCHCCIVNFCCHSLQHCLYNVMYGHWIIGFNSYWGTATFNKQRCGWNTMGKSLLMFLLIAAIFQSISSSFCRQALSEWVHTTTSMIPKILNGAIILFCYHGVPKCRGQFI